MISLAEINAAAERYRVPAETIEKDYIISWILLCLSKSKLREDFIFYGGTAIKRIYFEDHRFSEDIDLISSKHFTQDYLLHELDVLHYAREEANLILELDKNNIISNKNRTQLFIHYSGYDEISGALKEIRLDFAMNMDIYGDIINKKIIESYSDLKIQYEKLSVMTLNTILANKLGLLMDGTRNEPRDLFDIHFLLQRTHQFNFDFDHVCNIFKAKYGFRPLLHILLPSLKNNAFKINWSVRLNKQVPELPDIKVVTDDIEVKLIELFGRD